MLKFADALKAGADAISKEYSYTIHRRTHNIYYIMYGSKRIYTFDSNANIRKQLTELVELLG